MKLLAKEWTIAVFIAIVTVAGIYDVVTTSNESYVERRYNLCNCQPCRK